MYLTAVMGVGKISPLPMKMNVKRWPYHELELCNLLWGSLPVQKSLDTLEYAL